MNEWLAWGGSAAIVALIASTWRQIAAIWYSVQSRIVVSIECRDLIAHAITSHCFRNLKSSPFGHRTYIGFRAYVRPNKRFERIAAECVGKGAKIFWQGWTPILITREGQSESGGVGVQYRSIRVTFLRGTICADTFVQEAVEGYNDFRLDSSHNRYRVQHCSAAAQHLVVSMAPVSGESGPPSQQEDLSEAVGHRIIRWTMDDLGPPQRPGRAIETLSLSSEAHDLFESICRWYDSDVWHEERGLPWKMGAVLHGLPGTGKTAFVRAVASDLNLPVFSYDLATFRNDTFRRKWKEMQEETPCIALIEDLDAVFVGRTPATEDVKLTFDCLLNCIDGVERANGLLLFVTTNNISAMDSALVGGSGAATRPGRIDIAVEFGPLSKEGRESMARRIVEDWPEQWDRLVSAGSGETGAQFERRCIEFAITARHKLKPQKPSRARELRLRYSESSSKNCVDNKS